MNNNSIRAFAFAGLVIASFNTFAVSQTCATNVPLLLNTATYKDLNAMMTADDVIGFTNAMKIISNQDQYQVVVNLANTLAAKAGATGRVVVTLPDGTVVVDTKKGSGNNYDAFANKAVNENHNTRVAILDAQLWPCGVGIETKLSTSTGVKETTIARRLGNYLDNVGTVRISR